MNQRTPADVGTRMTVDHGLHVRLLDWTSRARHCALCDALGRSRRARRRARPDPSTRPCPELSAVGGVGAQRLERGPARVVAASSCSCGSTFRSLPHTGQRPAQSGRQRIWSGTSARRGRAAQASRSSVPVDDVLRAQLFVRRRGRSPGTPARRPRSPTPAGARQRMHGPSSRVAKASRSTSPLAARWTTSSAGTSRGVGAYASPPNRERLERQRERLAVLLAGAESKRPKGKACHGREGSAGGFTRAQRSVRQRCDEESVKRSVTTGQASVRRRSIASEIRARLCRHIGRKDSRCARHERTRLARTLAVAALASLATVLALPGGGVGGHAGRARTTPSSHVSPVPRPSARRCRRNQGSWSGRADELRVPVGPLPP